METYNELTVHAPWRRTFDVAQQVDQWPRILPHYRWVRVHAQNRRRGLLCRDVEMAAHRTGFPVRWRARQELRPAKKEIYYRHTRSLWTQGMDVWWRFRPLGKKKTLVSIVHRLEKHGVLARLFYQRIVSDLFIHHVAQHTLRGVADQVQSHGS